MNRWFYYIGFLVLSMSMLFISSCVDEAIPPDELGPNINEGEKEIPLMISLKDLAGAYTYGTDYPGERPEQGSVWEDSIKDVTVYIFNQSFVCEKIITATTNPTDPVMVKTGMKSMVAVVNAAGKINLPTTESATIYPDLLKMLTNASATMPTSPFLMAGIEHNVSLPNEVPLTNPYRINIDVARTVAKVKIKVMKSGQALNANITLKNIYLYQGADRVALLDPQNSSSIIYNLSDTAKLFKHTLTGVTTGEVPDNGDGYCAMADSFYTFESLCGSDKSKGVKIVLESEVNSSSNIRTAEFYLGEYSTSPGDTVYDVKRNYWYDVTVNIVKPGMDSINVKVKTCPWNVADTIPGFPGDGFEAPTAIPFKLVKNYTDADILIDGSFLAIDKHTKGASWIDLKVTEGTPWNLKLKDNSARNENVYVSTNSGTSWTKMIYDGDHISGTGNDVTQRIYIYRTYQENNEPKLGPTLFLESGSTFLRDFVIQPRDTTPIPTNSYILRPQLSGTPANETHVYIPLAGVYRYWEDYLLNNGDSIPGGNTTEITTSILWQDGSGVLKAPPTVINPYKRDSAYIFVEAGSVQGNAVVDMKVGGVTYWSFHLWVTEYNPEEAAGQKLLNGNILMDRNLGALSNNYDAAGNARGLYYQFGRKDPFPRGNNWTNTFSTAFTPVAMPTSVMATNVLRPLLAIPASINNPKNFYIRGSSNWVLSRESNYLWTTPGGNKTAFDPCPKGWRVPKQPSYGPTSSPWYGLNTTIFVTGVQTNGRYSANVGYYPFSGYINFSPSAAIVNAGTQAFYWSAWQNSTSPNGVTGLEISTSVVNLNQTIDAGFGASVRCIADNKVVLN
jgi:hypothetical protein